MNRKFVSLMVAAALLATSTLPVMADDKKDNDRADVTLTMTSGNEFFTANNDEVMVMKELSVPYFDLELYGMEDYYYNPDCYDGITDPNDIDTPKNPGTKETAEGNVTLLHALIYATEIYQLQLPEEEAGQGALFASGEMRNQLSISGGVGSIYFTGFWEGSSNLNYYLNYQYPMSTLVGMGATADQILLEDEDHISIHRIADTTWTKYGTSFGVLEADGKQNSASVAKGEKVTLDLAYTARAYGSPETITEAAAGVKLYYSSQLTSAPAAWTLLGSTDSKGQYSMNTADLSAGTYYISNNSNTVLLTDATLEASPAIFVLTIEETVRYGDVNADGKVNSNDASLVLRYAAGLVKEIDTSAADVNGDGKVNSNDASMVLRYAAGLISKFPVENK